MSVKTVLKVEVQEIEVQSLNFISSSGHRIILNSFIEKCSFLVDPTDTDTELTTSMLLAYVGDKIC